MDLSSGNPLGSMRKTLLRQGAIPNEWNQPRDGYGLLIVTRNLLPFLALLAVSPVAWARVSPWTVLIFGPLVGLFAYRLTIVMHDCCHASLFVRHDLNRWVGDWCGALLFTDFAAYSRTHLDHHRYNGSDGDPQYPEVRGLEGRSRAGLAWHLFSPLIGARLAGVVRYYLTPLLGRQEPADGSAPPSEKGRDASQWVPFLTRTLIAQAGIAMLVTGFGAVPWLILLHPLGSLTVGLFLSRFRAVAEHMQPAGGGVRDFTRSHHAHTLDALLLYEAHFNYHVEHHLFPGLPSCRLPLFHERWASQIHTPASLGESLFGTVFSRLFGRHD